MENRRMIPLIEAKKAEIIELCRRHGVKTLELFGSATGDGFDPETSDLDFLVEYGEDRGGNAFRTHFDLKFALEDLFLREVDLVEVGAIRNPYFLKAITKQRTPLYAA